MLRDGTLRDWPEPGALLRVHGPGCTKLGFQHSSVPGSQQSGCVTERARLVCGGSLATVALNRNTYVRVAFFPYPYPLLGSGVRQSTGGVALGRTLMGELARKSVRVARQTATFGRPIPAIETLLGPCGTVAKRTWPTICQRTALRDCLSGRSGKSILQVL